MLFFFVYVIVFNGSLSAKRKRRCEAMADLEKLEKDLNNLDIESLNDGLEDNDKDSAGF